MRRNNFWPTNSRVIDNKTKLLMHMEGVNNGTSFFDETGKAITTIGSLVTSSTQKKIGVTSMKGFADDSYATIPAQADFNLGSDDFTVKFWIRLETAGMGAYRTFFATGSVFKIYVASTNIVNFWYAAQKPFSTVLSANTWYHIALVRSSGTVSCYLNGIKETKTYSLGTVADNTEPITVGSDFGGVQSMQGYMDELRFSKGIARYTSNFTPSVQPFSRYL